MIWPGWKLLVASVLLACPAPGMSQDPVPAGPKPRRPLIDVAEPPVVRLPAVVKPVRDPNVPRPSMDSAPKSVPVRISGVVRDLAGRPIPGATVRALLDRRYHSPLWVVEWGMADATAASGEDGRYRLPPVEFPTQGLGVDRKGFTPYIEARVLVQAPGYGIGWHQDMTMFALPLPDPDDISLRLPLRSPMEMDAYLRPEAELKGRVLDELGRPVPGVKVECGEITLLDEAGLHTRVRVGPAPGRRCDGLISARTGGDGRFRLPGLPAESCCWLRLERPDSSMQQTLYASTSGEVEAVHAGLREFGTSGHRAQPAEMTVTMVRPRRLDVRVVGEDDGKPVPEIDINAIPEVPGISVRSGGTTDADGKVAIDLPPGGYPGLEAEPTSADSRFVQTELRPVVVAPEPDVQPLVFRIKAGSEVSIEAVDAETGRGIPDVRFDIRAEGEGRTWARLPKSRDRYWAFGYWTEGEPTGADGKLRSILDPRRKGLYRVRVAGIGQDQLIAAGPNLPQAPPPPGAPPAPGTPGRVLPYEIDPGQSEPFEPAPGKPVKLRFVLRKKE